MSNELATSAQLDEQAIFEYTNQLMANPENHAITLSTIGTETVAEKAEATALLTAEAEPLKGKLMNKVMWVKGAVISKCVLTNTEDGVPRVVERLVMVLDDGRTVGSVSTGIVSSFRLILHLMGEHMGKNGLPVIAVESETSGNKRVKKLVFDAKSFASAK